MPLSLFVLALYVFLESATKLTWFVIDPKLTGFVGMAFVVAVILEAIFYNRLPNWFRHRPQA